ncbi:PLP-dependent transferase [Trametopsis cervina]|nr:PLP-dependent transferase [Trametopsis cervina]
MSATATVTARQVLGGSVPPLEAHAISVSLPTWEDNIGYEEGDKRVIDVMVSGYPRFFIHLSIRKLARICAQKFGLNGEQAMLFPTRKIATACRTFMLDRAALLEKSVPVRLVQFFISPETASASASSGTELHIVLFPGEEFPLAKQFWQHAGLGISSRMAEHCLAMLPDEATQSPVAPSAPIPSPRLPPMKRVAGNRHYAKPTNFAPSQGSPVQASPVAEDFGSDHTVYLEERYGRNLPVEQAETAKRAMRRRIAGTLVRETPNDWSLAGGLEAELGPSTRGVKEVSENDVFLYPTGMSAIWSAHQVALGALPPAKSICFGFPYTDTLKTLQKWGPGCHFLGYGLDSDIDELEKILHKELEDHPDKPPALALFTEFPSNPLLRSANLPRLRALADQYDFLIIVDETIGNTVNVEVLPYADIVVSSLSKVFSGDSNVMGGSLVLNPKGRHYSTLKSYLATNYEDSYFDKDAIFMERNSRDFARRIRVIDANTEAVCDFLQSNGTASKTIFYPKYVTSKNYKQCQRPGGGYGGLFSITFHDRKAAKAFFDALPCHKGPSLGTNFTLACPYTILGHYLELDWAAGYGVDEGLVRVSVGLEDKDSLIADFRKALRAADEAVKTE